MRSISFPGAALAVIAAGLMLAGCVSNPSFSLEQRGRPGVAQQSFAVGEVPTVSVDATWWQLPESAVRVRQLPGGTIVRRLQVVSGSTWRVTDLDTGRSYDVDRDPAERERRRIPLNDLGVGDYVAELWTKGAFVGSIQFSVTGVSAFPRPASGLRAPVPPPAAARRPRAAPFDDFPSARSPKLSSLAEVQLNELDAYLGLSPQQKDRVEPLLRAEEQAQQSVASIHDIQEVQRKTRVQIRALLTPEQQARYDEIGPKGVAVGRLVERLNQLVGLSEEQKEKATAIFSAQNEKLDALPSPQARAVQGAPIRQSARAQIRAILTSDQQRIYDDAPQMMGGGSMHARRPSAVPADNRSRSAPE